MNVNGPFLFSAFTSMNESGQLSFASIPPGSFWANPPLFQEGLSPSSEERRGLSEEHGFQSDGGEPAVASTSDLPSVSPEEWWAPLLANTIPKHQSCSIMPEEEKEEDISFLLSPTKELSLEQRESEMRALGMSLLLQEGGFDRLELPPCSVGEDIAEPQEVRLHEVFLRWTTLARPHIKAWRDYSSLHHIHPLEEKSPQFLLLGDSIVWVCWKRIGHHLSSLQEEEQPPAVLDRDITIFRHVERLWATFYHSVEVIGTVSQATS